MMGVEAMCGSRGGCCNRTERWFDVDIQVAALFFPPTAAIGAPYSAHAELAGPLATSSGVSRPVKRPHAALYRLLRHSARQNDNDSATVSSDNGRNPAKSILHVQLPRHHAPAASQKFLILSCPETSNHLIAESIDSSLWASSIGFGSLFRIR